MTIKENIRYAILSKNLKIGDVEEKAGKSSGYLSRKHIKDVPISFMMVVSSMTGYSIDELVSKDLSYLANEARANEIKKEIDKLQTELKDLGF